MQATANHEDGCTVQLAELIKEYKLSERNLSDLDIQLGVQCMEGALKLLVPLASSGTGKRVNSDGRVIGGGRTQVCPSTYLTRCIFFLLAKVLAPPQ